MASANTSSSNRNRFAPLPSDSPLNEAEGSTAPAAYPTAPPPPRKLFEDSDTDMSDYEPEAEAAVLNKDPDVDMAETSGDSNSKDQPEEQPSRTAPVPYRTNIKQVPANLEFTEFPKAPEVHPDSLGGYDLTVIHKEYRAKDLPNLNGFRINGEPAQVMFHDKALNTGLAFGVRRCVGKVSKSKSDMLIKVSFETSTQLPSLKLRIARQGKGHVDWHVFANCIKPRSEDGSKAAGLSLDTYGAPMDEATAAAFEKRIGRGHENLTEQAKAKNLMRIKVNLVTSGDDDWHRRPIFTGLPDQELLVIRNKAVLGLELTPFEHAIYMLDSAEKLDIFRKINCPDMAQVTKFENHFFGSMHMCSAFRNFWFYQFQLEKPGLGQLRQLSPEYDIYDRNCKLEGFEPPRWLVELWRGSAVVQGAPIVQVEPLAWQPFKKIEVFPTIKDCAFYIRLALARECESQKQIVHDNTREFKGACQIAFTSLQGVQGVWTVKIALPSANSGGLKELIKPSLDTRVKVSTQKAGGAPWRFEGQVIESPPIDELTGNIWDFAARLIGPQNAKFKDDEIIEGKVEFVDDKTTSDRARSATENMASTKLKRKIGVDIPATIFRTVPTIPDVDQDAGAALVSDPAMAELKIQAQKLWKLNDAQGAALESAIRSDNGLTLLYGPPGTGKTQTTAISAYTHVRLGNKVLYACSSNKAVDTACSAFVAAYEKHQSSMEPQPSDITIVRFVGGYRAYQDLKDRSGDSNEWEGIANTTMLAAAKSNPEQLFHVQLNKAIGRWKDTIDHAMQEDAQAYSVLIERAKKYKIGAKSEQAVQIRTLEDKLTKYFLRHEVDIVFTTCSSAHHQTLYAGFEPATVFIDEAGQATIAELCMALDPFKDQVKWLIMSGDYNQLMPVVTAKTANEALSILEASLFRQLIVDEANRYPHVMLKTQYRSHPDLVDWCNRNFYGGQLESHGSTRNIKPVAKTIRQFFGQLRGVRKNNRNRIAIDVSSEDAVSVKYKSTSSFCNYVEAELIVAMLAKLFEYEPVANDTQDRRLYARVMPANVGVICGYKGQARLIMSMLQDIGKECANLKVFIDEGGEIGNTWAFSGSEVDFAIISMCCSVRGNPMEKMDFTATPNALCVQNSRARCFQVTVGNFKGWCEALIDQNTIFRKRHYGHFKDLVIDFHKKGDIVPAEDVVDMILSDKPRKVQSTSNSFYEALPILDSTQYTRDKTGTVQKLTKLYGKQAKKSKGKACAGSLQDAPGALQEDQAVEPKANPGLSNRQKKKERQKLAHQQRAETAKAQAELNEELVVRETYNR